MSGACRSNGLAGRRQTGRDATASGGSGVRSRLKWRYGACGRLGGSQLVWARLSFLPRRAARQTARATAVNPARKAAWAASAWSLHARSGAPRQHRRMRAELPETDIQIGGKCCVSRREKGNAGPLARYEASNSTFWFTPRFIRAPETVAATSLTAVTTVPSPSQNSALSGVTRRILIRGSFLSGQNALS
jgi:hypothetical protein